MLRPWDGTCDSGVRYLSSAASAVLYLFQHIGNWEGYWSSFSFWVMLATYSFKARSPRTQDCASASEGHTRSRLFLAPLKTTVKHWLSCTDPDRRLSDSDWQPSRTHSTSVTATGREKTSPEWVGDPNNTHGVKQPKSDTANCKILHTLYRFCQPATFMTQSDTQVENGPSNGFHSNHYLTVVAGKKVHLWKM